MLDQETKKMNIDELTPANYNPRLDLQPGDDEYEKLKRSIQEFGYVEKIIWNKKTGNIVGGHQRWKVLKDLGYEDIEVVVIDEPENREKLLNIALNKIEGDWDTVKLKDLLQELDDGSNDMLLTGYDENELENLLTQFHVDEESDEPVLGNTDEGDFNDQYAVMVVCDGEDHQEKTYTKLTEQGYICKVVSV